MFDTETKINVVKVKLRINEIRSLVYPKDGIDPSERELLMQEWNDLEDQLQTATTDYSFLDEY